MCIGQYLFDTCIHLPLTVLLSPPPLPPPPPPSSPPPSSSLPASSSCPFCSSLLLFPLLPSPLPLPPPSSSSSSLFCPSLLLLLLLSSAFRSGHLSNSKRVVLGTKPIVLKAFRSSGSVNVFACSNHPTIIHYSNHKLLFSNVNLRVSVYVCQHAVCLHAMYMYHIICDQMLHLVYLLPLNNYMYGSYGSWLNAVLE